MPLRSLLHGFGVTETWLARGGDGNFGKTYGLEISDSAFANLHSRAVIVINSEGNISYSEQVSEIANEPNYENALAAI